MDDADGVRLDQVREGFLGALAFAVCLSAALGCGTDTQEPAQVSHSPSPYHVVKDESEDTPIHSLVRMHIVLDTSPTHANLTELLNWIYDQKKKGPFKYHPNDPDILIFAYTDEKRAAAGTGLWAAKLDSDSGKEPVIQVDDDFLARLNRASKPSHAEEKIFGLNQAQRQQLVYDVESCQDKAMKDAERRYPNDIDKQAAYNNRLNESCIYKFRRKYHVSEDHYYKIVAEGIRNKWPDPPLQDQP